MQRVDCGGTRSSCGENYDELAQASGPERPSDAGSTEPGNETLEELAPLPRHRDRGGPGSSPGRASSRP